MEFFSERYCCLHSNCNRYWKDVFYFYLFIPFLFTGSRLRHDFYRCCFARVCARIRRYVLSIDNRSPVDQRWRHRET